MNLELANDPQLDGHLLYDFALEKLSKEDAEVIGFTSMCLESHICLELARRVKEARPSSVTLFGGTHFGAIANETLKEFSFCDYAIAGEGEDALVAVLNRLAGETIELPSNVFYREGAKVTHGASQKVSRPLEELAFPAYDLIDVQKYFSLNPIHLMNYEAGRGCVFKCSFCYSPFQYGDAVRNKPIDLVIKDLRRLSEMGAQHVFFVQDNLLNSPKWALTLCKAIAEANLPLTWECYATYPQLQESLIDALADAGCAGIFTGIDAVAPPAQVRMNKRFLHNWQGTSQKLSRCRENGIRPICAFILEGPDQPIDEIDDTIRSALECLNLECEIHLNTLSFYNGIELKPDDRTGPMSYSSIKAELMLDTPRIIQNNEMARSRPELFPYHSTFYDVGDWEVFTARAYTLWASMNVFSQTIYQYGINEKHSIWELYEFVNVDVTEFIRTADGRHRRLNAALQFSEHLAKRQLSAETQRKLAIELSQLVLSTRDERRQVLLQTEGSVKPYVLAWYVNQSNIALMRDSFRLHRLEWSFVDPALWAPLEGHAHYDLAVLAQNETIRLYVVDKEHLTILSKLAKASFGGTPVPLSLDWILQLENEGWLWPSGSGESCPSQLDNVESGA